MWLHRTSPSTAEGGLPAAPLMRGDGFAVLLVMMALALLGAVTGGLIVGSGADTGIAAVASTDVTVRAAATAALQRARLDLRAADWEAALGGGVVSFTDGPSNGIRTLSDGRLLDLAAETANLTCGRPACAEADVTEVADGRPWGLQNPRWRVFAHAELARLVPAELQAPPVYVMVWIADDPTEEGDALLLAVRAYGLRGVRRTVQVALRRRGADLRTLSWHEVGP